MKTSLIGISGKIAVGKDTFTNIFQKMSFERSSIVWENKKFAFKLKQFASLVTGIPVEDFEKQEVKASNLGPEWNYKTLIGPKEYEVLEEKSTSVRDLLIAIGNGCRDIVHTDIWINALFSEDRSVPFLKSTPSQDSILHSITTEPSVSNWIITDMRYRNEFERVKSEGGITIRINSNRAKIIDHISETDLDDEKFDFVIDNSGTIEELEEQVYLVGQTLNIWR
jgi:hypothetical protein